MMNFLLTLPAPDENTIFVGLFLSGWVLFLTIFVLIDSKK